MSNLPILEPAQASASAKPLLEGVQRNLGVLPNMFKALANSPAALGAYLGFAGGIAKSRLSPKLREHVALTVAGINACTYCASAHTVIAKSLGIDAAEARNNLLGKSADPKVTAALGFARNLITKRGRLAATDFQAVKTAGFSDEEIVEIIAQTALSIFTNYFNLAAGTELDFPKVEIA